MLSRLAILALPAASILPLIFVGGHANGKTPTFAHDVAPILYRRCTSCHSDRSVAPFSLVGYENARNYAKMMASVTAQGVMPPWKAAPGYGEFRDVALLSQEEKDLLREWAAAGAPRGTPSEEPVAEVPKDGWQLGKPDLIVTTLKPCKIPAEGGDFYRDYLVDPKITKPTWVRGIEFRPSGKNTVHHVIPFLLKKEEAEKCLKIKPDFDEGWKQDAVKDIKTYSTLGMWSTGAPPFHTPDGTAFLINPGDRIMLDLHYKTTGKPELEQTQVGLYFLPDKPKEEMSLYTVASKDIYIDPGLPNARIYVRDEIEKDMTIHAIWPHMHFLGRTFKAWVKYPAGYGKPLVCIRDWDPDWQLVYYLKEPMFLPKGSVIYVTGTYDNTTNNLRNPNRLPKIVESGPSSKDEMLLLDLYVVEKKDPSKKDSEKK
jgi:hypothetical protein